MKLVILGSGSIIPSPDRNSSGYALHTGKQWLIFDLGAGNLRRLAQINIQPHQLQHIFFSHYHLDHIGDLQNLFFALRVPGFGRTTPLHIYGPPGLKKLIAGFSNLWGKWIEPKNFELRLRELQPNELLQDDDFIIQPYTALHTSPPHHAYSYRVTHPTTQKIFAYSGDTDEHPPLIDCCADADLALLECSTPDSQKIPGHLSPSSCANIAKQARIQQTILTHFYPSCFQPSDDQLNTPPDTSPEESIILKFQEIYSKKPILAKDLMEIEF